MEIIWAELSSVFYLDRGKIRTLLTYVGNWPSEASSLFYIERLAFCLYVYHMDMAKRLVQFS